MQMKFRYFDSNEVTHSLDHDGFLGEEANNLDTEDSDSES